MYRTDQTYRGHGYARGYDDPSDPWVLVQGTYSGKQYAKYVSFCKDYSIC